MIDSRPPLAERTPHVTSVHGHTRTDEWFWLREKDSPKVRAYLEAENAYTRAVRASTEGFQETLYREMLGRIQETDMDVPYRYRGWEYYTRTEQGKDYPIYCRRALAGDTRERVLLDLNQMAQGHEYFALGAFGVSPEGHLLAFSTDITGFREYTLQVKDLRSDKLWVHGGFEPATGQAVILTSPWRDSASHVQVLEKIMVAFPADRWLIIEDNLSIHVSRSVKLALAAWPDVQLQFIPKYACWLNLIEPWWKQLRSWL